jgi:hypothetical protein
LSPPRRTGCTSAAQPLASMCATSCRRGADFNLDVRRLGPGGMLGISPGSFFRRTGSASPPDEFHCKLFQ